MSKKFNVTRQDLADLVNRVQQRQFTEELDYLESKGGDRYILANLAVNVYDGLNTDDVPTRFDYFGSNRKKEKELPGFFELFREALEDTTLRILLVSSIVSVIVEEATSESDHRAIAWIEGFAIFVAVMICATVTAGNNYRQERQFRLLYDEANRRKLVNVMRDGKLIELLGDELCVGDVVQIVEGIEVPADGFVTEGHEVTVDESAMTGETDPMKKAVFHHCIEKRNQIIAEGTKNIAGHHAVPSPILYSGTKILTGEGWFVVIVVGELSCVGKIQEKLNQETEATPLQQKLETIADDIGRFGLKSAVLTVIIMIIRFIIDRAGIPWQSNYLIEILNYLILGITVMIVAIPEGLPLAVTLSLAYSVKKMLKDNNLVRRLEACETMGGANIICSDKTGTLTQNKMTLTTMWNDEMINLDNYAEGLDLSKYCPVTCQNLLIESIACNSSATIEPLKGSKTEIALLQFLERSGVNIHAKREHHLSADFIRFPFTSQRKRMGTVLDINDNGNVKLRLHEKGASEILLSACSHFHSWRTNQRIAINHELNAKLESVIDQMASKALRTILVAYKDLAGDEDLLTKDDKNVYDVEKSGFTCLAIFGIKDVLREAVPASIISCRRAGIQVKMVTGDNKLTARAIAKECGIIEDGDSEALCMEGIEFIDKVGGIVCKKCKTKDCDCPRDQETADLEKKDLRIDTIQHADEFDRLYRQLRVLARSRPEDKYALVTGLKERGLVVAVTGDGTNDAPALKKADVGFAMGISGTEVAREAAAIILLDDNFNSIIKAVVWGRNIYDSIRKFIQFQLTVNLVAVGCTLIGAALLRQAVLSAIQMLWVNLIMDTLASLALATEPPNEKLLDRKPHKRTDYIVSRKMTKHIVGQAIYQLIVILTLVFAGERFIPEVAPYDNSIQLAPDGLHVRSGRDFTIDGTPDYIAMHQAVGPSRQFTVVFTTFVFMQIFNFLNARKLNDELFVFAGLFAAPLFCYIVAFIVVAQVLITEFAFYAAECHRHGLTIVQWVICLCFGAFGLIISVVLKFIPEDRVCPQLGATAKETMTRASPALSARKSSREHSESRKYSGLQLAPSMARQASLAKTAYNQV